MADEETKAPKSKFGVTDAFSRVAIWQVMAFIFLTCFVWVSEMFDLPAIVFSAVPTPFNIHRLCLLTAGIITAGVIAVGHSYEKQRSIVEKILQACLYCHRVKTGHASWEHIEEYFIKNFPVGMSRGVCPDCEKMLSDLDKHVVDKD
jgi:hypothetical protein